MLKPLITEKSMKDASGSKYTFKFPVYVNKNEIKTIIEQKFTVNVLDVATIIVKGRTQRNGTRREEVRKSPWKKAIVTVEKGQKIGLFELGEEKK